MLGPSSLRERSLSLSARRVRLPLRETFRISGRAYDHFDTLVVIVSDGVHRGWGECSELLYLDMTIDRIEETVRSIAGPGGRRLDRAMLAEALPPGPARNAIDCALWDLASRQTGRPAWALAGLPAPRRLATAMTIGAAAPAEMALRAAALDRASLIKIKLAGDDEDMSRVSAVREARPGARLLVDANQGLTPASMRALAPGLEAAEVEMLEQPLPRGSDHALAGMDYPIPIFGDESVQTVDDVARAARCFDGINIKLDKCGGLTAALEMATAARERGLGVMVGNMGGTSIAMSPAFLLAQVADYADLDGPLFLRRDVSPGARYEAGQVDCTTPWGNPGPPGEFDT